MADLPEPTVNWNAVQGVFCSEYLGTILEYSRCGMKWDELPGPGKQALTLLAWLYQGGPRSLTIKGDHAAYLNSPVVDKLSHLVDPGLNDAVGLVLSGYHRAARWVGKYTRSTLTSADLQDCLVNIACIEGTELYEFLWGLGLPNKLWQEQSLPYLVLPSHVTSLKHLKWLVAHGAQDTDGLLLVHVIRSLHFQRNKHLSHVLHAFLDTLLVPGCAITADTYYHTLLYDNTEVLQRLLSIQMPPDERAVCIAVRWENADCLRILHEHEAPYTIAGLQDALEYASAAMREIVVDLYGVHSSCVCDDCS